MPLRPHNARREFHKGPFFKWSNVQDASMLVFSGWTAVRRCLNSATLTWPTKGWFGCYWSGMKAAQTWLGSHDAPLAYVKYHHVAFQIHYGTHNNTVIGQSTRTLLWVETWDSQRLPCVAVPPQLRPFFYLKKPVLRTKELYE